MLGTRLSCPPGRLAIANRRWGFILSLIVKPGGSKRDSVPWNRSFVKVNEIHSRAGSTAGVGLSTMRFEKLH